MAPGATSPIKETQRLWVLRVFIKKNDINYGGGGECEMKTCNAVRVTSVDLFAYWSMSLMSMTIHGWGFGWCSVDLFWVVTVPPHSIIFPQLGFIKPASSSNKRLGFGKDGVIVHQACKIMQNDTRAEGKRFKREWVKEEMRETVVSAMEVSGWGRCTWQSAHWFPWLRGRCDEWRVRMMTALLAPGPFLLRDTFSFFMPPQMIWLTFLYYSACIF